MVARSSRFRLGTKRKSLSPIQYQDYFQVEKENENHKSGEARVYVRGYINVNIFFTTHDTPS